MSFFTLINPQITYLFFHLHFRQQLKHFLFLFPSHGFRPHHLKPYFNAPNYHLSLIFTIHLKYLDSINYFSTSHHKFSSKHQPSLFLFLVWNSAHPKNTPIHTFSTFLLSFTNTLYKWLLPFFSIITPLKLINFSLSFTSHEVRPWHQRNPTFTSSIS